jgi:hypothetical protein
MTNPRRPRTKLRPRHTRSYIDEGIIRTDASTTHHPDTGTNPNSSINYTETIAAPFNAPTLNNATESERFRRLLTNELPQRRDPITMIDNDPDIRYIKQSARNMNDTGQTRSLAQLQKLIADATAAKAESTTRAERRLGWGYNPDEDGI